MEEEKEEGVEDGEGMQDEAVEEEEISVRSQLKTPTPNSSNFLGEISSVLTV